jgi:hypothetical protein
LPSKHTILMGVGGTIYSIHTLEPFKELGLGTQRAKNRSMLPSFMFILSTTLPNLSIPNVHFPVQLSIIINSHPIRIRFQLKPATLLIPIDFLLFCWWRNFTVPGTKVAPFPYLMRGVVFHCLRNFFLFFSLLETEHLTLFLSVCSLKTCSPSFCSSSSSPN